MDGYDDFDIVDDMSAFLCFLSFSLVDLCSGVLRKRRKEGSGIGI
jgi:hypothetical protein